MFRFGSWLPGQFGPAIDTRRTPRVQERQGRVVCQWLVEFLARGCSSSTMHSGEQAGAGGWVAHLLWRWGGDCDAHESLPASTCPPARNRLPQVQEDLGHPTVQRRSSPAPAGRLLSGCLLAWANRAGRRRPELGLPELHRPRGQRGGLPQPAAYVRQPAGQWRGFGQGLPGTCQAFDAEFDHRTICPCPAARPDRGTGHPARRRRR